MMDLSNIGVNAQSSIRIAGDKILYFDPFEICEELHDADAVFITHEHYDHFQPESISKVIKENTCIIAPLSMEKQIRKEFGKSVLELWEPGTCHERMGMTIETVPAYNIGKIFHPKRSGWMGYVVSMDGIRYYVSGDTDDNEDLRNVRCDVALVPVGGKYTMNKKQAAELLADLRPRAAIPTHYGSIVGDPMDGMEFKKYLESLNRDIQTELRLS